MAKARIGTTMNSMLTPRADDGDLSGDGFVNENGREVPFWWTKEGVIIKWSIFFGLIALFLLYLIGGYLHARRRMRKGLAPLRYHRCLVPRAQLARVDPAYAYPQNPTYTNYAAGGPPQGGYYGMQPMPPPVYDPNRPPMYDVPPPGAPPQGGSKLDPAQAGDYAPPPGPPPPPVAAQRTGNSNPFADPARP
ncbi:hypothetical protein JX266_009046 [Neoarthrinium moseri]|nr:hypothetical protein JX266_009046 [Neoarthrinium moseri]